MKLKTFTAIAAAALGGAAFADFPVAVPGIGEASVACADANGMHVEKLFHYGDHDTGGKCHFRGDGTAEKLMEHYGCTRAGLDGMAIAPRRRAAVRPEFPAGATLSAKMEERGKDGDLHRSLTLEFPIVNGIGGGVRAYDYEVAVDAICFGGNAQRGVKRYFSPKCHFAPSADTGTMTVTYGLDEFKAWNSLKSRNWGALHVAVRPRETFGGVGRALEADVKAAERIGT